MDLKKSSAKTCGKWSASYVEREAWSLDGCLPAPKLKNPELSTRSHHPHQDSSFFGGGVGKSDREHQENNEKLTRKNRGITWEMETRNLSLPRPDPCCRNFECKQCRWLVKLRCSAVHRLWRFLLPQKQLSWCPLRFGYRRLCFRSQTWQQSGLDVHWKSATSKNSGGGGGLVISNSCPLRFGSLPWNRIRIHYWNPCRYCMIVSRCWHLFATFLAAD